MRIQERHIYLFLRGRVKNVTKFYSYNRTYVLLCRYIQTLEEAMRLLRLAVEKQRWDLAAHTIVLVTARLLNDGEKLHANRSEKKKRRPKGQSER